MIKLLVPEELAASHARYFGEVGLAWTAGLPDMAEAYLSRWDCSLDGTPSHGMLAWVLPVRTNTGEPAILKLQPVDDETVGEPVALRTWDGQGAVRLLRDDPATGAMLLERCDPERSLGRVPDDLVALQTLSELLARLTDAAGSAGAATRWLAEVSLRAPEHAQTLRRDVLELMDLVRGMAASSVIITERKRKKIIKRGKREERRVYEGTS